MAIAIGIEAGLATMQASGIPAVAALSADNLKLLALPASVREVVISADGTDTGQEAAEIATRRFRDEGRIVRVAVAGDGKEFADALRV